MFEIREYAWSLAYPNRCFVPMFAVASLTSVVASLLG
jgi:hypothetical protein